MSTPCKNYPIKFVSCCDVMDCIDIHSDDNSVTVVKSECGVDLSVTSNNLDEILQIEDGECISFTKEFISGKLVITPSIDWDCVATQVCNICSGPTCPAPIGLTVTWLV